MPTGRPAANKAEAKVVPLPSPATKQPGLITSFINMVDIAEVVNSSNEKKK